MEVKMVSLLCDILASHRSEFKEARVGFFCQIQKTRVVWRLRIFLLILFLLMALIGLLRLQSMVYCSVY